MFQPNACCADATAYISSAHERAQPRTDEHAYQTHRVSNHRITYGNASYRNRDALQSRKSANQFIHCFTDDKFRLGRKTRARLGSQRRESGSLWNYRNGSDGLPTSSTLWKHDLHDKRVHRRLCPTWLARHRRKRFCLVNSARDALPRREQVVFRQSARALSRKSSGNRARRGAKL